MNYTNSNGYMKSASKFFKHQLVELTCPETTDEDSDKISVGSESSSSYSMENVSDSCGPSSSRNQRSSDESSGLLEEPSCCYEEGYWINSLIIINKSTGIDIDFDMLYIFLFYHNKVQDIYNKVPGMGDWASL